MHRIADAIVEAEKDLPHKHLIAQNIANGSKKIENPHRNVSVFNLPCRRKPWRCELSVEQSVRCRTR